MSDPAIENVAAHEIVDLLQANDIPWPGTCLEAARLIRLASQDGPPAPLPDPPEVRRA
jgi:hypothetical protein